MFQLGVDVGRAGSDRGYPYDGMLLQVCLPVQLGLEHMPLFRRHDERY